MMVLEILAAAFLGLLIGSFLNVCIHRLPEDESLLQPARSYCPHCRAMIAWYDNIPVLSYILLRAKCRACGASISWRYPLVEAITGILFGASVYVHGWNWMGLKHCIFAAILVDLVFTDLETYILPDEFTLGGSVVGLVMAALAPANTRFLAFFLPATWPLWLIGVLEGAFAGCILAGLMWTGGMLFQKIRGKEGLGLGDVKMLLVIGVFLGLPATLLTVFLGSLLGSIVGGFYIVMSRKDWDFEIPFGTFLGFAAMMLSLFGDVFFKWYWKLG
ncbi:MAG: prepilin peptidase [Acidobacteria bacterium]|nr:prepilin peptidase [Acidobacteriota bacterium]